MLDRGCGQVYIEGRGLESWREFVRSLRKGDEAVVATAAALPNGPAAIRTALSDLDKIGVVLVVADTGLRSDKAQQRADIVLDAIEGQRQNRNTFDSKTGKSAAKKSWKKRAREKLSAKEALVMWRDIAKYPNTQELLTKLAKHGWTSRMLYKAFGGRFPELGLGRPRKPKKD